MADARLRQERTVADARLRRTRAVSATSIACEQAIVHTEHTLGASPEVCFYAIKLPLSIFDGPDCEPEKLIMSE